MSGGIHNPQGRNQRSGWLKAHARRKAGLMEFAPGVDANAWLGMLARTGIPEEHAERAIAEEWPGSKALARFAAAECTRRFIPETVLGMLGLTGKVESSCALSWRGLRHIGKRRAHE